MARRVVIDPVTRIEGHLRVDVEVDGGAVSAAWASGQMWRGLEVILRGRDPRDAWLFAQRICGVCTTVHAITSVRAVEDALELEIPPNANHIRNLILIAHALHDHIVHFYHLSALDWVDVTRVLEADPQNAARIADSLSPWPRNSHREFGAVKEKVQHLVNSGQLGIFTNGYWGHPAMRLEPDVCLIAVAHYLQAFEFQRKANQIVTLLGGKTPNIQNLAVGGVANAISLNAQTALNMEKLHWIRQLFTEVGQFVREVYLPDVVAIGAAYPDWLRHGAGSGNYLAVPDLPLDPAGSSCDLAGGTIFGGDLGSYRPIESYRDAYLRENVQESIAHSWYQGNWTRHPWEEDAPVPAYGEYDAAGAYSWVKSPRFRDRPMEVGPLAEVLMGYARRRQIYQRWVDGTLDTLSSLAGRDIGVGALRSTLGRHVARAVRTAVLAELAAAHWQRLADSIGGGDSQVQTPFEFPDGEVLGAGFHAAPRGALSHWIAIQDGEIGNYQCVVPSTWNAGPRDARGQPGPYEASLVGNPIADPERPLEALRTIHSFDPCLACAVHTHDPTGATLGSTIPR